VFACSDLPHTGKTIKNHLNVNLKGEKICYKILYYTLHLGPIIRNRIGKNLRTQKFSEKGLRIYRVNVKTILE